MVACPVCATESPEGFRFCPACGAALEPTAASVAPAPGGERKAVTALFCDLAGFTSLSESADPEDVDRMLAAYFALARREIERHGGTVEKFIGDAVVGIFGAPATHEDDPERAVRSGLRICRDAADLRTAAGEPLRLRVGINTGETLVHTGATPEKGEALVVGDAINTAARIQSAAPEMGVAVGFSTWQSTHLAIEYTELPPATLKGKVEPVRVFQARAIRASLGVDLSRSHAGGYVGRTAEIASLRAAFADATTGRKARFVAVVGEPGIGKSRIVAELAARVHADRPDVAWRQGRCLPYGDGVTFWALGEILKAHAGILEDDDPSTAAARINDALPADVDRDWLRERLLPLVGAGGFSGEREEQFGAWRTFLAGIAQDHPAVFVFEDVHWADDALLAFLDFLGADPPDVPLLVLLTARPTGFSGMPGLDRLDLEPLSDDETERLITGILGSVVPAELHGPIVERAQGNPLYAEEFVRLLVDRDLLVRTDGRNELREGAEVPVPGSISALLGARLDALPPSRKALLADAAVLGKVFWSGAVAAMAGRDRSDVEADLAELAKVELVRPAARSSMAGEAEYAFWHVLARDVAYNQLPRTARASRHQAAGNWLETKAGSRVDDIAQLLAYHYATALDLAVAAGETDRATVLEPCALRFLRIAGERAIGLDTQAAVGFLERALALAPPGHSQRPPILVAFAEVADQAGRHEESAQALEEAIAAFEASGDPRAAGRGMLRLRLVYDQLKDPRFHGLAPRALDILTAVEPSEDLVIALTEQAVEELARLEVERGLASVRRALDVADQIGMTPPARTLRFLGHARMRFGDLGGLDDFRRAIDVAKAAGQTREAAISSLWYAGNLQLVEGMARGRAVLEDALDLARSRGLSSAALTLATGLASMGTGDGQFDTSIALADDVLPLARANHQRGLIAECLCAKLYIHAVRGNLDELSPLLAEYDSLAPSSETDGTWTWYQSVLATAWAALGQRDAVRQVLSAVLPLQDTRDTMSVGEFAHVAAQFGIVDQFDWQLGDIQATTPLEVASRRWAEAHMAHAHGDLAAAAEGFAFAANAFARLDAITWEAFTRLDHGRTLLTLGRSAEAVESVVAVRSIFVRLRPGRGSRNATGSSLAQRSDAT